MNGNIYSTIIGTIVSDPQPFFKVQGSTEPAGCSFRVAINRSTLENQQWKHSTQFIEITARGPLKAKSLMEAQWCKKGYHAYFSTVQTERSYIQKSGAERKVAVYTLLEAHPILVSDSYRQMKSRQEQGENGKEPPTETPNAQQAPAAASKQEEDDDIPF